MVLGPNPKLLPGDGGGSLRSREFALHLLRQAEKRLRTAEREAGKGSPAYAVRSAQECVELSLKAALRLVGIEYPKKHDVKEVLLRVGDRFPDWFRVGEKARVSSWLAERREAAMYGDEAHGVGPNALFTRREAIRSLNYAKKIYGDCKRFLEGTGGPSKHNGGSRASSLCAGGGI
jgi:HEPN domain-containing protein